MKQMLSLLRKKGVILPLILFFVGIISLFPITEMFFIRDDFMIIYKVHNHRHIGAPYESLLTLFNPLYSIFGLNPFFYFLLGLILFAISTVFLYVFLRKISNTTVAFFTTLLYATGLIGLESMIQMVYVIPIPLFIIVTALFLTLFVKYIETKNVIFIGLSILIYYFALNFFSYRAHLLYAYIFLVDFFLFLPKELSTAKKFSTIAHFIIRQIPYLIIFFRWWSPLGTTAAVQNTSYFLELLTLSGRESIIINFSNLFLQPISIISPSFITMYDSQKIILGLGIFFLSIFIALYSFYKKHIQDSLLLLFSLSATFANLIFYYFFNPGLLIDGISRYHFGDIISFNLYIVSLFLVIRGLTKNRLLKNATLIILMGIFLLFFSASSLYTRDLNQTRSIPTKKFYKQLKEYMPSIPKGSIIYIDRKDVLPYDPSEFVRVGRLPVEASFASMYGIVMENLTYSKSFDDVEKYYKNNPSSLNLIFGFYIHEQGITNITQEVRKGLPSNNQINITNKLWKSSYETAYIVNCGNYTVGIPPVIETQNLSFPSFVPKKLNISIRIKSLDLSSIDYPYYQVKGSLLSIEDFKNMQKEELCENVRNSGIYNLHSPRDITQYISYRKRYKELAQSTNISASETLPEDPVENLLDNDPRTIWTPDISAWSGVKKSQIILKFPSDIKISKIIISPAHSKRLPKTFSISALSSDGKIWNKIKNVENAAMKEEKWYEVMLPLIHTSALQIEITDTNTGSYPQLSELYVVEELWKNMNIDSFKLFNETPFLFLPDKDAANELYADALRESEATLFWKRDKDDDYSKNNYVKFPVVPDGNLHTYTIIVPAGGIRLEKIRLEGFNIPGSISTQEGN